MIFNKQAAPPVITKESSIFEDRRIMSPLKYRHETEIVQDRRKHQFNTSEDWYLRASCLLIEK